MILANSKHDHTTEEERNKVDTCEYECKCLHNNVCSTNMKWLSVEKQKSLAQGTAQSKTLKKGQEMRIRTRLRTRRVSIGTSHDGELTALGEIGESEHVKHTKNEEKIMVHKHAKGAKKTTYETVVKGERKVKRPPKRRIPLAQLGLKKRYDPLVQNSIRFPRCSVCHASVEPDLASKQEANKRRTEDSCTMNKSSGARMDIQISPEKHKVKKRWRGSGWEKNVYKATNCFVLLDAPSYSDDEV